jgi:hypothetical protein
MQTTIACPLPLDRMRRTLAVMLIYAAATFVVRAFAPLPAAGTSIDLVGVTQHAGTDATPHVVTPAP